MFNIKLPELVHSLKNSVNVCKDYVPYQITKNGTFNVETNEYNLELGWMKKQEKIDIIGETKDTYTVRIIHGNHGLWIGDIVVGLYYSLPLGVHKSRFVSWNNNQLKLI